MLELKKTNYDLVNSPENLNNLKQLFGLDDDKLERLLQCDYSVIPTKFASATPNNWSIAGPNGAGKSYLVNKLLGSKRVYLQMGNDIVTIGKGFVGIGRYIEGINSCGVDTMSKLGAEGQIDVIEHATAYLGRYTILSEGSIWNDASYATRDRLKETSNHKWLYLDTSADNCKANMIERANRLGKELPTNYTQFENKLYKRDAHIRNAEKRNIHKICSSDQAYSFFKGE